MNSYADNMTKKNEREKRARRPLRPFPHHSIEKALEVALAIQNNNAGKPMKRLLIANSLNRKPSSQRFKELLSSSFKYGLTIGTEKAEYIELTELGRQITKPTSPDMVVQAKQKAVLTPPVFQKIYTHYKDAKFPKGEFFENALETEFGVPREYIKEIIEMLEVNGKYSGIIRDISGSPHVLFGNYSLPEVISDAASDEPIPEKPQIPEFVDQSKSETLPIVQKEKRVRKIFISHGKNKKILSQIETTIKFGGYEPVIATLRESTAIPVPEKIMNAMHECEAGIINVSADEVIKNEKGIEQYKINENVLIEIGAAFVLYKKKVILVVDKRITLPSNLQGLYLCYYEGDSLDWEAGTKLQNTLIEFKSTSMYPE